MLLGLGGSDQIYGDSGVNVDIRTRTLTIPTDNASPAPNAGRPSLPGADAIDGGSGPDMIFGDHGAVVQDGRRSRRRA